MSATIHIGTSGFTYAHWRGVFYPAGVSQRRWLEYYAEHFQTVELNVTFYRQPKEETFQRWAQRVPPGFIFAVKLSRYLTHTKRLREVAEGLEYFLRGARLLGEHLGPILIQLPPGMHQDLPRLDDFLVHCDPSLRWAVEFRDPSWFSDAAMDILTRHRVALCIHDMLNDHPRTLTAPFTYLRFHGTNQRYSGSYPDTALQEWAQQLQQWQAQGIDSYAYFNNDAQGFAVMNARTLQGMVAG